jgi:hypothetical protein
MKRDPEKDRERKRTAALAYEQRRQKRLLAQLEAGTLPERKRAPVNPVNRERRAERWADGYHSGEFVEWVKSHPCCVPACGRADIEVAHVRSRGAGGSWQNVVPLCGAHHRRSHTEGIKTFERSIGFPLADVAAEMYRRWTDLHPDAEEAL